MKILQKIKEDKLITGLALATIIAIILLIITTFKNIERSKTSKEYSTVCINGHEYYIANIDRRGFMGIKLNDNGTPVRCEEKKN